MNPRSKYLAICVEGEVGAFPTANHPKRISVRAWFGKKACNILQWLSQATELNPEETSLAGFEKSGNIPDLKAFVREEWANIPRGKLPEAGS